MVNPTPIPYLWGMVVHEEAETRKEAPVMSWCEEGGIRVAWRVRGKEKGSH